MSKILGRHSKLLCFIIIFTAVFKQQATAQSIINYSFSSPSGTFVLLSGATNPTLTGTTDEGYFNNIPIGFDFWYMGVRTTSISASTNGWITPGKIISDATPVNNLVSGGTIRPILAPLWDDLDIVSASNVSYLTTGTTGSRIFIIQYLNVKWSKASGNTISFQVKLYENTGQIDFIYKQQTSAVTSGSASIGITAVGTGNNNYLALHSDGTVTTFYDNGDISKNPSTGQIYSFTPALPIAPTNLVFSNSTSSAISLNWTDNSNNEIGFAIYHSTDGVNYSYDTLTTANAITATLTGLTANTIYYWKVLAVTEGALSSAALLCISPAPTVISPVNYCLNTTATALTATGSNLLWGTIAAYGSVGGTATLNANTFVDNPNAGNNKKTYFTTTKNNTIITTIDYYVPANQAINGLVLGIYNNNDILIATSATTTSFTAGATTIKMSSTFNYNILVAGNYKIGIAAGTGNIGYDNPTFPITEVTGSISITGVSVTGKRCFNNIQFTVAGTTVTAPVPSTTTIGTTNYLVSQTVNGCLSPQATIAVSVSSGTSPVLSQIPTTSLIGNYTFTGNAADASGNNNTGTLQNLPATAAGRFGIAASAYSLNGSSQYISTATAFSNPTGLTVSIWFKTASVTGGMLIGFGSSATGPSAQADRHMYMNNAGQVYFGMNSSALYSVNSALAYNDNIWHLATGTASATAGMVLYIDGVQIANNATGKTGDNYTGYWRIGYDNITSSWPSAPSSFYFNGLVDDALIYSRALTATEINTLYNSPDGAGNNGPVCAGSQVNLSATIISGATYAWAGPNSFTSSLQNPAITFTTATAGTYTLQVTVTGCSATAYTNLVPTNTGGVWTGNTSTSWADPNNWCGGIVPAATTNVVIGAVTNKPVITAVVMCNNLIIAPNASLTVTAATLHITGIITNSGTLDMKKGTLDLAGATTQTIAGSMFAGDTLLNLTNSNAAGIIITSGTNAGLLYITGALAFGNVNNTVTKTGDNIVLVSTAAATATVADITNNSVNKGNTFSGKVAVERFFPARRAWRLATSPLSATGSIYSSWQNNGNNTPGRGTYISGPGAAPSNGLDNSPLNNSSLKEGSSFTPVVNTSENLSNNTGNADNKAFFIFVRGDRTAATYNTNFANTTTISSIGNLQTGAQTFTASPAASGYTLIGNPYASSVNFATVTKNNLANRFYVWDPYLNNQQGGYVLMDDFNNTGTYTATPSNPPGGQNNFIQSSQAIWIQTALAGTASISFTEPSKAMSNNLKAFKVAGTAALVATLNTNLYLLRDDSTTQLADGNMTQFAANYNAAIDMQDALKFSNVYETLGLLSGTTSLAADRRPAQAANDTIFFKFTKTRQLKYQFEFVPANLNTTLLPVLHDTYTGKATLLSNTNKSTVNFEVDTVKASQSASRFYIVFTAVKALPATYTSVKASPKNNNVSVRWQVENELNIKSYTIEKGIDGANFAAAGTIKATAVTDSSTTYNWIDVNAVTGINYYRIKNINTDGSMAYSKIVQASIAATESNISVYPNPVVDKIINLQFTGMPKGNYNARVINNQGQIVLSKQITYTGGTATQKIKTGNSIASGTYKVEVTSPDNVKATISILIQ